MIEKVRVHEIAKELGIASKDVLEKAKKMGLEVKSAQSVVTMEQAEGLANFIMNGEVAAETEKATKQAPTKAKSDTPKQEETPEVEEKSVEIKAPKEVEETPKVETLKEEAPKVDVPEVETAKEDTSKEEVAVVESKEEPIKKDIEEKKSPLKVVTPVVTRQIKRTGLKIVKKKKPKVVETYSAPQKQAASVSSYGKMSAEVLEELAQKKNV